MTELPRIPPPEQELSRRSLLRYGAAGLAAAALGPLLHACRDDSLTEQSTGEPRAALRSAAVREPTRRTIRFRSEVVAVAFGERVRQSFVLRGRLRLTTADTLRGRVNVLFPDGTRGTIRFAADTVIVRYRHSVRLDLRPDSLGAIDVNGSTLFLNAVALGLKRENDGTGIGPLSPQSRAFLVPVALGSSPAWRELIGEVRRMRSEASATLAAGVQMPFEDSFTAVVKSFIAAVSVSLPPTLCPAVEASCLPGVALPLLGEISRQALRVVCDVLYDDNDHIMQGLNSSTRTIRQPQTMESNFRVLVDDKTTGFHNAALGTILDGSSELFPVDGGEDPTINPAPEPDLSPATEILGDWLSANPLPLNANWSVRQAIPPGWELLTETAILYPIDVGASPTRLTGNFAVDNGIFVWVNGQFRFGALAPGGAEGCEYANVDLGTVPAGANFIQILREDHGVATGYRVQITSRETSSA